MAYNDWAPWPPYVPVAKRRRDAQKAVAKLQKRGVAITPVVVVAGWKITGTFWGTAWCRNLESYSDLRNRLTRGRSYVRNGLVVHLAIEPGKIKAFVRGSAMYDVAVTISPVPKARWRSICTETAGAIDSLVELLQGRFSKAVMDRICRQDAGLFPAPREIEFTCSCPDSASMCKHIAAVLYGVGVRLDEQPELLFRLRHVSEHDLIASAGAGVPLSKRRTPKAKVLEGADLSALFGLQLGEPASTVRRKGPKAKTALGRKKEIRVGTKKGARKTSR